MTYRMFQDEATCIRKRSDLTDIRHLLRRRRGSGRVALSVDVLFDWANGIAVPGRQWTQPLSA